MGETAIRFRNVMSFIFNGSNSFVIGLRILFHLEFLVLVISSADPVSSDKCAMALRD